MKKKNTKEKGKGKGKNKADQENPEAKRQRTAAAPTNQTKVAKLKQALTSANQQAMALMNIVKTNKAWKDFNNDAMLKPLKDAKTALDAAVASDEFIQSVMLSSDLKQMAKNYKSPEKLNENFQRMCLVLDPLVRKLAIQQTCIMKQKGAKDEAQKEAEKQDQGGEPVAKASAA